MRSFIGTSFVSVVISGPNPYFLRFFMNRTVGADSIRRAGSVRIHGPSPGPTLPEIWRL